MTSRHRPKRAARAPNHHPSLSKTQLVGSADDIPAVRDDLERWLDDHASLDSMRTYEVLLAATELLTNAFEHGGSATCLYNTRRVGDHLTLTITNAVPDAGVSMPTPDEWSMPAAAGRSGRGLAIVKTVADNVSLEIKGRTVAVAVGFDLQPETPARGPAEATLAS